MNNYECKITSRLNNTPPIGAPKATDMPAAAAADSTSRFRAKIQKRNLVPLRLVYQE